MQLETIRCFVAVEFPERVHQFCAQLRDELSPKLPKVSWVKRGNIHLTFEFLGDITLQQKDKIAEALRPSIASLNPFDMTLGGVGVFPNWRRPRVLWVGIDQGQPELALLAHTIRTSLGSVGAKVDGKPFRAHLTLARIRRPSDLTSLQSQTHRYQHVDLEPVQVDHVLLMQSVLHPQGSIYTPLESFPLEQRQRPDLA